MNCYHSPNPKDQPICNAMVSGVLTPTGLAREAAEYRFTP